MTEFVWPSDRARAENPELNRVCEYLEDILDSEEAAPQPAQQDMYRRLADKYRQDLFECQDELNNLRSEYHNRMAELEGEIEELRPAQQGSVPESIATDDDVERVAKMAEREEWDGEGLPPVGVDIEILGTPEGCWSVGVVDYVDERHCIWHWKLRPNDTMHSRIGLMQFRPIRTKQQRLRDDLAELVLSGMKNCGYYPYETDASGIADFILSCYNLEPKP